MGTSSRTLLPAAAAGRETLHPFGIRDPGFASFQIPSSSPTRVLNPDRSPVRTPNPNPESRVPNPESRVQNPEICGVAKRMRSCEPCGYGLPSSRSFILAIVATHSRPGLGAGHSADARLARRAPNGSRRLLQNGREVVALDDVASLFQVSVKEDTLAGGVTVSYRGRTIVACRRIGRWPRSRDGSCRFPRRSSGPDVAGSFRSSSSRSRSPPFTTSASSSGERRGCSSSATCDCHASPRPSTAPVRRRARRSRSPRRRRSPSAQRSGTRAGTNRRRRPRPHARRRQVVSSIESAPAISRTRRRALTDAAGTARATVHNGQQHRPRPDRGPGRDTSDVRIANPDPGHRSRARTPERRSRFPTREPHSPRLAPGRRS